jgi:hypothetical protein
MTTHRRTHASPATEYILSFCALWFITGLFIDGWAHNHLRGIESFFTPWHAAFYSGFAALAGALCVTVWLRKTKHGSWMDAVPLGYEWALLGAAIFAVGGAGDMTWHIVFGVEADIEALLSPTHLVLATGMTLMLSGGMLSWMLDPHRDRGHVLRQAPMVLSASMIAAILAFMTQFSHFIDRKLAGMAPMEANVASFEQALGVTGVLLPAAILCGIAFFVLRAGRPMFGFFAVLFASHVFAMGEMRDTLVLLPAAIIAGILCDLLLSSLQPLGKNGWTLRMFAFAAPALLFAFYDATVLATTGSWWSIHMWAGLPVLAGFVGVLMSLLVWPPHVDH